MTYLIGKFREKEWSSTQLFLLLSLSDPPPTRTMFFALFLNVLSFPGSGLHRKDHNFPALPKTGWRRLIWGFSISKPACQSD